MKISKTQASLEGQKSLNVTESCQEGHSEEACCRALLAAKAAKDSADSSPGVSLEP